MSQSQSRLPSTGEASSSWLSEKSARSPENSANNNNSSATASKSKPKLRSCVICRTRKVRCDKQSPCSNCRRGNVECVFPSTDRPPRWARRLDRAAASQVPDPASAQVMERLRNLESLVKELNGQLEQANAVAHGSPGANSTQSSAHDHDTDAQGHPNVGNVKTQFGRLVVQDANRSRYVSSGFWSRVNDEVRQLPRSKESKC